MLEQRQPAGESLAVRDPRHGFRMLQPPAASMSFIRAKKLALSS
jgi:hypothetical protein